MQSIIWVKIILLIAAIFLVPLSCSWHGHVLSKKSSYLIFIAAIFLCISYFLPQSDITGFLAIPWLIITLLLLLKILDSWRKEKWIEFPVMLVGIAYFFLPIGASWAVLDRFGISLFGFDPVITLLTAVHFHYAGFALTFLTGLALQKIGKRQYHKIGIGVLIGVPLVALGITTSQMNWPIEIEVISVLIIAISGIGVAILNFKLALTVKKNRWRKLTWLLSAICLFAGMILAMLYGLRYYFPIPWLSIPWMYAVHGTLNSIGFSVLGFWVWLSE